MNNLKITKKTNPTKSITVPRRPPRTSGTATAVGNAEKQGVSHVFLSSSHAGGRERLHLQHQKYTQHNQFQFLIFSDFCSSASTFRSADLPPPFCSSSRLLLQAEIQLVWDGDGKGGAGGGWRCCPGSGSALLWSW